MRLDGLPSRHDHETVAAYCRQNHTSRVLAEQSVRFFSEPPYP